MFFDYVFVTRHADAHTASAIRLPCLLRFAMLTEITPLPSCRQAAAPLIAAATIRRDAATLRYAAAFAAGRLMSRAAIFAFSYGHDFAATRTIAAAAVAADADYLARRC